MDTVTFPPFQVTPAAIAMIEQLGGAMLIDLEPGGCCGTAYTYESVACTMAASTHVEAYGCPGAWLLVTRRAGSVLPGATVDYGARLRPPRFRILRNPNTPQTCPCRRSFGAPWPGPGRPACRSYDPMPWDIPRSPE